MEIDKELIDKLLGDYKGPEDLIGEHGLLKELTRALVERAMHAELTHHLGYEKHAPDGKGSGNSRNGTSAKTLKGDFGEVEIEVPRDRNGSFEPKIVPRHQRRFNGFDDKILSMYARGMTTREIQGHLQEIYGVEVSPSLISEVTDAVIEEVKAWQTRPLEPLYPILFLDALMVKMRHEGRVENRAVYVAIGIDLDGRKDVLGLWTSANEGAKFWLQVLTELRNRGVKDVFIACVDGLKGFPQAIETVFPQAQVQLCIVHLVRASLNYVGWKERKQVAQDLKSVYRAATEEEARREMAAFAERWNPKYAPIAALWQRNWDRVIPFFQFPAEVRKVIYTTNAVESLNMSLRKALKTRVAFPSEDAALKVMYLALRNVIAKWESPLHWKAALNQFTVLWEDRIKIATGA
ncbi:MAG: IS256 family transposase [Terriglobia bacterium]|jgi:putative transposase|nr:IS256 family transposase [Terriglobia bacterium]